MVTRDHIISEIRRIAAESGGAAPGVQRFGSLTGIRTAEWRGVFWARWSDALREAGYSPNDWVQRRNAEAILAALVALIRRLERIPTEAEMDLQRRDDASFPSTGAIRTAFGSKAGIVDAVRAYCVRTGGLDDVIEHCDRVTLDRQHAPAASPDTSAPTGEVYLLRSGSHFKIGRSVSTGRRGRELAIQLPHRAKIIHTIITDDPVGVEAYWHRRFEDRRGNGEWFSLNADDVAAFRRWRKIY